MASTRKTAKPAAEVVEETAEASEPTTKQIVNDGINRVIEAHGIDVQKNRYKAMRAIAWQAFANAVEDGTFDELVDEAIANVDSLPAGWEIEKPEVAAKPAPKTSAKATPAKKTPAKTASKPAAKTATARKRPSR
jgi:hypothetical protein